MEAVQSITRKRKSNGHAVRSAGAMAPSELNLGELLDALHAMPSGDFSVRLPGSKTGVAGKICDTFNTTVAAVARGGLLQLDSAPGAGTTVHLWLPRAPPAESSTRNLVAGLQPSSGEPQACNVLVVDDDLLVLTCTAAIEAHSGAEALAKLAAGIPVDVVITDYAMPNMTGLQLAQSIQERYPGLPIVLATGCAELPADPAKLGVMKLAKPCTQDEIGAAIQAALNSAASRPPGTVQACA